MVRTTNIIITTLMRMHNTIANEQDITERQRRKSAERF